MEIRERHPDLPPGASRWVEEAGATELLPVRPAQSLHAFSSVTVAMGNKRLVFQNYGRGEFKFGRAGNNNLILEASSTSRRHATLYIQGGRVKFRDISRNASTVGKRVYKYAALELPQKPTKVEIFPHYQFEISHDGKGNVRIEILKLDRYFVRPRFDRELGGEEGFYFTPPIIPADRSPDASGLTSIVWPNSKAKKPFADFVEQRRVTEDEIVVDCSR